MLQLCCKLQQGCNSRFATLRKVATKLQLDFCALHQRLNAVATCDVRLCRMLLVYNRDGWQALCSKHDDVVSNLTIVTTVLQSGTRQRWRNVPRLWTTDAAILEAVGGQFGPTTSSCRWNYNTIQRRLTWYINASFTGQGNRVNVQCRSTL